MDLSGMTTNVSYNGLWAARHVVTPVETGPFEAEQADALRRDLAKIGENFAIGIKLTLVLPKRSRREPDSQRSILRHLRENILM